MQAVQHIFLVEDNAGDILLIRQILAGLPIPIHLHIARDGDQALFMMAEGLFRPDLILLDLNLPNVSGSLFLARSKPEVPVVVFSSSANPEDVREAMELGATAFVQKPMDFEEYRERVARIVSDWLPSGELTTTI
jgi:CheY-like chemotaxis protein